MQTDFKVANQKTPNNYCQQHKIIAFKFNLALNFKDIDIMVK